MSNFNPRATAPMDELSIARRTIAAQKAHIQVLGADVQHSRELVENFPSPSDQTELLHLRVRLAALERSTSWRITRPLRATKSLLRALKRRLRRSLSQAKALVETPPPLPLVTVIVPNYNHARFLKRRLDSIYSQTYPHFEVILLDDCSTDDSTSILTEYADRFADNTRLVLNKTNSGTPFAQWARGIQMARGDIVWIAESDDTCDAEFLSKLAPLFQDEAVLLAYGDIQYIDGNDRELAGLDSYRLGTGYDKWRTPYVNSAAAEFDGPFGARNIIPNVSGAAFRTPAFPETFYDTLSTYKICGDWLFYQRIAAGGRIAYTPHAKSYFRQHGNNSSVSATSQLTYYDEHRNIAQSLVQRYGINEETLRRNFASVNETYVHQNQLSPLSFAMDQVFDIGSIANSKRISLNILICSLGFTLGGGELLPIFLANAFQSLGHNVTFLAMSPRDQDVASVRRSLNKNIAVLRQSLVANPTELAQQFDVVNTHNIAVEYFFRDLRNAAYRPVYVVTHHGSYEVSQSPPDDLLSFSQFVDQWVYLTERNLHRLWHAGVDTANSIKLPNGVPSLQTTTEVSRATLGLPQDSFVVGLISRAIPEKGWQEAIDAVRIANSRTGKRVELVLVGAGPEYDRLKDVATPDYVHLVGLQPNAAKYYSVCDVGILPTYFLGESFPLTIAECLTSGHPAIATDIGEIGNMITSPSGQIAGVLLNMEPHGGEPLVNSLAHAILRLRDDPTAYQNARLAAAACGDNFKIDAVAERYIELFRSHSKIGNV